MKLVINRLYEDKLITVLINKFRRNMRKITSLRKYNVLGSNLTHIYLDIVGTGVDFTELLTANILPLAAVFSKTVE